MDDQVKRAMARWPSVPAVYGWLRLGRRGSWFLIDRNAPGFDPVRDGGGSPITSPPIIDFIHRNYEADDDGNWYFQNGPQRVFVTLDHAPLIFRAIGEDDALALAAQTGQQVEAIHEALFDRQGNLFLRTDVGPGMVDDRDLVRLMTAADESLAGGDDAMTSDVEEAPASPAPDTGPESARLALPRYGFEIAWNEDVAREALPIETIASRFGFRRRPGPSGPSAPPA